MVCIQNKYPAYFSSGNNNVNYVSLLNTLVSFFLHIFSFNLFYYTFFILVPGVKVPAIYFLPFLFYLLSMRELRALFLVSSFEFQTKQI